MENKEPSPVELLKMFVEGAKIVSLRHNRNFQWIQIVDGKVLCDDGGYGDAFVSSILNGEYELYREPKKLKRFWIWNLRHPNNGSWFMSGEYLDENGKKTNGANTSMNWDNMEKRKAEPEQFIDVEVEE